MKLSGTKNEVKRLELDHASAIQEILQDLVSQKLFWGRPWTLKQIQEEIVPHFCRGLFKGPKLVAFLFIRDLRGEYEITLLGTSPEFHRQGAMTDLWGSVQQELNPKCEVFLEVHEKNISAHQLYEKLGFLRSGRRPFYYPDGCAAWLYRTMRSSRTE